MGEQATMPLKIGVLISGSGSNLQALIDQIAEGSLAAQIVTVISSRPDAYGLERAAKAGIPTVALNREVYRDAREANQRIADILLEAGAEYVIMAGYMRKVTEEVLNAFPDRVVNLHPALLPSFKGAHAIEDAFNFGAKVTGITVHFANEDYDKGPIIAQRAVEVREDDTLEALEARIHEAEHELYPEVVSLLAQRRVHIDEATRTVRISN
ncbi:MAG: phosphoribosylglycinamide formyltransferase [Eggerthellaceae bacterium]